MQESLAIFRATKMAQSDGDLAQVAVTWRRNRGPRRSNRRLQMAKMRQ
jgi:hypothetical protein